MSPAVVPNMILKVYFPVQANHLAYIAPKWNGSQISADCQPYSFSLKHDGRFLLVTFPEEHKRNIIWSLEHSRDRVEKFCEIKCEMKLKYDFVFLLTFGFYIINCN